MDVSVIIVTFNSAHCVAHAIASVPSGCEVIVVDNASRDGSTDVAAASGCRILRSERNIGFGAACNRGASLAKCRHLLFLNPDATLTKGAVDHLLDAARRHPDASAFGTRMVTPDAQQDIGDAPAQSTTRAVSMISGAAFFLRKTQFDAIGGFDERIFLYFEDEDLSLRLQEKFGPMLEVHEAIVVHQPGTGARLTPLQRFHKYRHYGRSRRYFSAKHGRPFAARQEAAKQFGKGMLALALIRIGRAAQHFGRCVGYLAPMKGRVEANP